MRPLFLTFLFIAIAVSFSPSQAGELEACGMPTPPELNTEAIGMCDLYARRLEYKAEDDKFRSLIDERRENYRAPQYESQQKYNDKLEGIYESVGLESDPVIETMDEIEGNDQISRDLFGEGFLY